MKAYDEFIIWNWLKERPATEEEIKKHVRIVCRDGKCTIEKDEGYALLAE